MHEAYDAAVPGVKASNCTPCHGPHGSAGEAVSTQTKEPVDLRTYVARNGGKFPTSRCWRCLPSP